ncbi:MAG: cytochrome c [Candidatus Manganitrophaceae bacterium]|nr:MAG: cytochrome c [Candidatus Manganitrophaceae bacterium]
MSRKVFIVLLAASFLVGCSQSKSSSGAASGPVPKAPAELAKGEALFNAHCARCHGEGAKGTDHGPPFLSKIYEPNHHGDAAFQLAPQRGVRSHHWSFGDMPKIEGVQPEEVNEIIPYIRWLQKQAGIF